MQRQGGGNTFSLMAFLAAFSLSSSFVAPNMTIADTIRLKDHRIPIEPK